VSNGRVDRSRTSHELRNAATAGWLEVRFQAARTQFGSEGHRMWGGVSELPKPTVQSLESNSGTYPHSPGHLMRLDGTPIHHHRRARTASPLILGADTPGDGLRE
jgi:hypothetical protein